jgi:hypothetical protein
MIVDRLRNDAAKRAAASTALSDVIQVYATARCTGQEYLQRHGNDDGSDEPTRHLHTRLLAGALCPPRRWYSLGTTMRCGKTLCEVRFVERISANLLYFAQEPALRSSLLRYFYRFGYRRSFWISSFRVPDLIARPLIHQRPCQGSRQGCQRNFRRSGPPD